MTTDHWPDILREAEERGAFRYADKLLAESHKYSPSGMVLKMGDMDDNEAYQEMRKFPQLYHLRDMFDRAVQRDDIVGARDIYNHIQICEEKDL